MFKNIQKYLLIHYPLIWNVRFVPMAIILILFHLIFFGIGYLVTDTSFSEIYHYGDELPLLYFISVLVGVLLFIAWLVFYNRNNGFKSFYPRKTSQLYLEWVMIFVIVSGISLVPVTLTAGHLTKWKSVASLDDAKIARDVLEKSNVLIPSSIDSYAYDTLYHKPIPIPENMVFLADTLNPNLYSFNYDWANKNIKVVGYVGASLLFYRGYYYYWDSYEHMDSDDKRKFREENLVKQWLQTDMRDSIFTVMTEFEKLRERHHLRSNITPEKWLQRIYNPPFFPVKGSTAIQSREMDESNSYETEARFDGSLEAGYEVDASSVLPYLPYENLRSGYDQVLDSYNFGEKIQVVALVCLCISIFISCLVFSFRFSKGKSWLIAFIATGVLIFITALLAVAFMGFINWDEEIVVLFLFLAWIALFIAILTKIIIKIKAQTYKGWSEIYLNLFVWMVPCIIPLIFFLYLVSAYIADHHFDHKEETILTMFWINIPVVITGMWFVASLIRKWKSLGDQ